MGFNSAFKGLKVEIGKVAAAQITDTWHDPLRQREPSICQICPAHLFMANLSLSRR